MRRRTRRHSRRHELVLLAVAAGAMILVRRARRPTDADMAAAPVRWWEIARGPQGVTEP